MKITRQQLRQLIESSVIKRGDDYVAPVETPLEDPRDFDFDLSDENKKKFFDLAGGDDASQAQADVVADALDFPKSGRFGADTFSKQMKMYDMGLDVINDPEIDQLLDRAIELYFNDYGKYLADDLFHVLQAGYEYPEGPGGFQLFLNGDPNFNKEDLDTELDITFFHPQAPAINIFMVYAAMRKMYVLIDIKLTGIQDLMRKEGTLAPEYLKQRFEKFKKAKELFKKRTHKTRPPALTQHVYDKMMKPMYGIFTTTHQKFNPEIDMSQIKESRFNIKISRRQLRRLIEAEVIRKDGVTIPIEDSLVDPMKDLDFNPEQKGKLKTLSLKGDQATKAQSDLLADMGGYEGSDRFGVDTFSDQVRLTEADLNNLMKVTDLYKMISDACNAWTFEYRDVLIYEVYNSEDYATFVEKVVATEVDGENKSDIDEIKKDVYEDASKKLKYTGNNNYAKIMDLFNPSQVSIRLIDQLVYDVLTTGGSLYDLYFDWRKYYMSGEQDIPEDQMTPELKRKIANIKESNI